MSRHCWETERQRPRVLAGTCPMMSRSTSPLPVKTSACLCAAASRLTLLRLLFGIASVGAYVTPLRVRDEASVALIRLDRMADEAMDSTRCGWWACVPRFLNKTSFGFSHDDDAQ